MFNSPIEFSKFIQEEADEYMVTCLEFLTKYIEDNKIDIEDIPPMLTPSLKEILFKNALKEHSMPKQTHEEIEL